MTVTKRDARIFMEYITAPLGQLNSRVVPEIAIREGVSQQRIYQIFCKVKDAIRWRPGMPVALIGILLRRQAPTAHFDVATTPEEFWQEVEFERRRSDLNWHYSGPGAVPNQSDCG